MFGFRNLTKKQFNNSTTIIKRYFANCQCSYDLVVVGGGIVGCATAREVLNRYPGLKVAVVEKENELAVHQSGNNSGVIHAGIYYKPGSLKAKLCVEGLDLAYKYLNDKGIPYKKVGKLIVALDDKEVKGLMELYDRALQNGVPDVQLIDGKDIKKYEPFCNGVKAIWSPHTGIVDWGLVTRNYGKDIEASGGDIILNYKVVKFTESPNDNEHPITIHSKRGSEITTRYVLTCGGLQSDMLATLTGCSQNPRIIPFRGEYLLLDKSKTHMIKGNIYPVPDSRFPFLGVHFTPRMDGSVWLGPNAVLAFKREGYRWIDINIKELFDALRYPGFIRMASKYFTFGINEMLSSIIISRQTSALQKFIPGISSSDISRGPSGVRAQALTSNGELVDDFIFDKGDSNNVVGHRVLHCRNAPSPGATSSLAIAKLIVDKLNEEYNIKQHMAGIKFPIQITKKSF